MDRVIENKRWIKKKYIPYLVGGALALILVIWLIFGNHLSNPHSKDSSTTTYA